MPDWPDHWPADVRQHYEVLAAQFEWAPSVVDGVVANVDYLRALAESDRPRRYFRSVSEGTTWFWEVVEDGAELVAVRQIEHDADGFRRYWWACREDARGFLTDQPFDLENDPLEPLTADAFERAWAGVGGLR